MLLGSVSVRPDDQDQPAGGEAHQVRTGAAPGLVVVSVEGVCTEDSAWMVGHVHLQENTVHGRWGVGDKKRKEAGDHMCYIQCIVGAD